MKSQKIDVKRWVFWIFMIACLLFIIFVSDQVIRVACEQQDRERLVDRGDWIIAEAFSEGKINVDSSRVRRELTAYAAKKRMSLALYDRNGSLAFHSGKRPQRFYRTAGEHLDFSRSSVVYAASVKSGAAISGYFRMEGPRTRIVGIGLLYCLFFLAGVGLLFYRDYLIRSYSRPVRFAARMAENILNGKYDMVASDNEKHESVLRLNLAMNKLSESLHHISRSYTNQRDSMETLIENIGNGLVLIDGSGRIEYVNRTFKEDFRTEAVHWQLADYHEVLPHAEICRMVDEVFASKKRLIRQLQLPVHIERKHFDVSCAPILDKRRKIRGIVLVFHDITGIKKLENMRKDFVANVSHELKTPITSLIGFTETLLDGARDDRKMEEQFLNIILHEGRRLQNLVKDLLELSKIERAQFSIDWQTVALDKVMDAVLLMFREKADNKHIRIVRKNGPPCLASGDPYRIRQIMINLVTNAINYTPEHGTITVSATADDTAARFIISDTGIGIAKDQIPRIFERFYRVDKARSRDSGGTGLGLAIVKHLVEAHHGHIDVTSESGKGTTFVISFRKASLPIG
ncbi:MAG: ATP-binding protein [Sporolactobacillus sp.]|nr:ATP-binding protein [Sporolactobacillus sp.]